MGYSPHISRLHHVMGTRWSCAGVVRVVQMSDNQSRNQSQRAPVRHCLVSHGTRSRRANAANNTSKLTLDAECRCYWCWSSTSTSPQLTIHRPVLSAQPIGTTSTRSSSRSKEPAQRQPRHTLPPTSQLASSYLFIPSPSYRLFVGSASFFRTTLFCTTTFDAFVCDGTGATTTQRNVCETEVTTTKWGQPGTGALPCSSPLVSTLQHYSVVGVPKALGAVAYC
jgi:hypothetical protein